MIWHKFLVGPVKTVVDKVSDLAPQILGVITILIFGWIAAYLIRKAIYSTLLAMKVDRLTEIAGLKDFFQKGKFEGTLSEILSRLVYWVTIVLVMVIALNAAGLTVTVELVDRVIVYMRRVTAAVFIGILGVFAANFSKSVVTAAASEMGEKPASYLGQAARVVIIIFTALTALEQLQISTTVIELTVGVILASIGLAMAIAFGVSVGLGAKDLVKSSLEDWRNKVKK